ncbi:hypothetical protein CWI39_0020p0090 [Hamiltosporidium magnivora]|uniref:Uncharacterized protein n=1 Tax=Hamiltosporidium magnivora TaxID=148818 RepID=A0A4Q9LNE4_9MICR|nr:hypothetical protein CWI39_0020p0090 [Hamiltosporidium magnivora]
MKNAFFDIKKFSENIEVEYKDEQILEKMHSCIEIGNNTMDLLVSDLNISPPSQWTNDTLLFILFYLYLEGQEYPQTLGSSYYMHYKNDKVTQIYKEITYFCYNATKNIFFDKFLFYVSHQSSNENILVKFNHGFTYSVFLLLQLFKEFTIENVEKVFLEFQKYDLSKIDNFCNKKPSKFLQYNQLYMLHLCESIKPKNIIFFPPSKALKKIQSNIFLMMRYVKSKNKFNFCLKNSKKIRKMLVPLKGLLSDQSFHRIFFTDIILFNKFSLYSQNFYQEFFKLKYILKIYLKHKIIGLNFLKWCLVQKVSENKCLDKFKRRIFDENVFDFSTCDTFLCNLSPDSFIFTYLNKSHSDFIRDINKSQNL